MQFRLMQFKPSQIPSRESSILIVLFEIRILPRVTHSS